jgi:hypothetical protein
MFKTINANHGFVEVGDARKLTHWLFESNPFVKRPKRPNYFFMSWAAFVKQYGVLV